MNRLLPAIPRWSCAEIKPGCFRMIANCYLKPARKLSISLGGTRNVLIKTTGPTLRSSCCLNETRSSRLIILVPWLAVGVLSAEAGTISRTEASPAPIEADLTKSRRDNDMVFLPYLTRRRNGDALVD